MACKCGYQTLENANFCLKCRSQREEILKMWIERSEELKK